MLLESNKLKSRLNFDGFCYRVLQNGMSSLFLSAKYTLCFILVRNFPTYAGKNLMQDKVLDRLSVRKTNYGDIEGKLHIQELLH
jgi:hypothetical protein